MPTATGLWGSCQTQPPPLPGLGGMNLSSSGTAVGTGQGCGPSVGVDPPEAELRVWPDCFAPLQKDMKESESDTGKRGQAGQEGMAEALHVQSSSWGPQWLCLKDFTPGGGRGLLTSPCLTGWACWGLPYRLTVLPGLEGGPGGSGGHSELPARGLGSLSTPPAVTMGTREVTEGGGSRDSCQSPR